MNTIEIPRVKFRWLWVKEPRHLVIENEFQRQYATCHISTGILFPRAYNWFHAGSHGRLTYVNMNLRRTIWQLKLITKRTEKQTDNNLYI